MWTCNTWSYLQIYCLRSLNIDFSTTDKLLLLFKQLAVTAIVCKQSACFGHQKVRQYRAMIRCQALWSLTRVGNQCSANISTLTGTAGSLNIYHTLSNMDRAILNSNVLRIARWAVFFETDLKVKYQKSWSVIFKTYFFEKKLAEYSVGAYDLVDEIIRCVLD